MMRMRAGWIGPVHAIVVRREIIVMRIIKIRTDSENCNAIISFLELTRL